MMGGMDPGWQALTDDQRTRWREVLGTVAATVPPSATAVRVAGPDGPARLFAGRLGAHLGALASSATVRVADAAADGSGLAEGGGFVVWLRVARGADGDGEFGADVVVDLHDVTWPVVRRTVAGADGWYLRESRAFFGVRAETWDTKFGSDLPAYEAAVGEARIPAGGVVLDVGCGTGRALPALRRAVGESGTVVGLDLTPQMLAEARRKGRTSSAALVLADARSLPVATGCADAVFAAGLVMHLPDLYAGLTELARVTRPGGRLVLFHPSGRSALAARQGRTLRPEDPLHERNLRTSLHRAGWHLSTYDDPPHRFLALADRT